MWWYKVYYALRALGNPPQTPRFAPRLARLKLRWLSPAPVRREEPMAVVHVVRPARMRRKQPVRNMLAQQAAELAWAQQLLRSTYR